MKKDYDEKGDMGSFLKWMAIYLTVCFSIAIILQ